VTDFRVQGNVPPCYIKVGTFLEELDGRDQLVELGVSERIILKCT
jgi:hypothetical protein